MMLGLAVPPELLEKKLDTPVPPELLGGGGKVSVTILRLAVPLEVLE